MTVILLTEMDAAVIVQSSPYILVMVDPLLKLPHAFILEIFIFKRYPI